MADIISKEKRSYVMSRIRSKDTKPETAVRSALHKMGYRFRLHRKDIPGTPDIVMPKHKTAIFVNGCFWHRHKNCRHGKRPKSNVGYWDQKILGNIRRDRSNHRRLRKEGWKVVVIWECEVGSSYKGNCCLIKKRLKDIG